MGINIGGIGNFSRGRPIFQGGSPNPQGNTNTSGRPSGNITAPNVPNRTIAPPPAGAGPSTTTPVTSVFGRDLGTVPTEPRPNLSPVPQQQTPLGGFGMAPDQEASANLSGVAARQINKLTPPVEPGPPVLDSASQAQIDSSNAALTEMIQRLKGAMDAGNQRLDADAAVAQSRMGDSRNLALDQLRQSLSNRGLLHSGINASEVTNVDTSFANSKNDLAAQVQRQKNQNLMRFTDQSAQVEQARAGLAGTTAGLLTDIGLANDANFSTGLANHNQNVADIQTQNQPTPLESPVGDINTMEGLNLAISKIFGDAGVNMATDTRTPEQRLADIAKQIISGGRTLDGVRDSVGNIASGKTANG